MKKIAISLVVVSAIMMFTACGQTDTNTGTGDSGDTYNVSVNTTGDGDVTIVTGDGTININEDDNCIFKQDDNTTRPCTEDEKLLGTVTRTENALYR